MEEIIKWVTDNIGIVIAILSICVEITPIKINPITWFVNLFNKNVLKSVSSIKDELTKEITDVKGDLSSIKVELSSVKDENDSRRIEDLRSEVLSFARKFKQKDFIDTYEEEDYNKIFDAYREYEELLERHNRTNGTTTRAMGLITLHYNRKGYGIQKIN